MRLKIYFCNEIALQITTTVGPLRTVDGTQALNPKSSACFRHQQDFADCVQGQ